MRVCVDELRSLAIIELLQAHLDHCRSSSPPESVHALDLDKLRASDVTFWSIWNEGSLLGCGALKQLDPLHGEIKSMHTAAQYRGSGVGAAMLAHIVAEARSRHYQRLSLETGSNDAFAPARRLYSSFGFVETGPFGSYRLDPNSTFMTLELT